MPKGFAKPKTQKFTVEISRRALVGNARDVEVEEYMIRVKRGPGKRGWEKCIKDAVVLAHLRIHDLLYAYCDRTGETEDSVAFDAFLWRNRTEGQPIFQLSTAPFKGSGQIQMIPESEKEKTAAEIIATKEIGRVVKKY